MTRARSLFTYYSMFRFCVQLSSVLALLEKSRVQREQFSTSPSEKDVLERALEARTSCVPGEAPSRLEAALKHYKDGQEAIRSCTNKVILKPRFMYSLTY